MNRIEMLRVYIDAILLQMNDNEERRCAYSHLYGVATTAALIAMKRGQSVELATMAGMLHDLHSYKTLDSTNHAVLGSVLAKNILTELELTTESETQLICQAIKNHSQKLSEHCAFDEVLIDADVLQHCLYNITLPISDHEKLRFEALKTELGLNH